VAVAGCATMDQQVKPPIPPEEYRPPPDNDRRYSAPIEYPKDTMDQDMMLKKAKENKAATPGPMNSTRSPGRTAGPGGF